jgi:glycogen operon protein
MNRWHAVEGSPNPLGATWIETEQAYNFALYSKHATGVVLLLYSEHDVANPLFTYRLTSPANKTGRVWHCRIPSSAVPNAKFYAYTVEGPFDPDAGHRFDPEKILLDPYAHVVFFPEEFSREAASRPGPNPGRAPLGVLPPRRPPFDWGDDRRPEHTHDAVIYELHVRGFTKSPTSRVSAEKSGTYAGLVEKIPYLKELGVTIVELLPVQQYDPLEGNYWGYMPLSFFAPHVGYSTSGSQFSLVDEFKAMVKALHRADIEVILDVVYNHTTEGNETGPTYSYRGIDNSTYYLLEQDRSRYRNDCGTGNVLHCGNRYVRKMILDSMRYWVQEMHIDGFRFDLASIFTRDNEGHINLKDPPIISEISGDPTFANVRLIAEAWDLASYQLGRSFPGITWLQWNAQYRDDIRKFVQGRTDMTSAVMTRLYGSDDIFPDEVTSAYHAYQSVNFITCHDGLTLYDLVCQDTLPALRERQMKNYFAILMLSNGTPMFAAGDEFMRTQKGHSNPYDQDNEISWVDWSLLERNHALFRFSQRMIAFRKAHPSLCRSRYWRDDVRCHGRASQAIAYFLNGASQGDTNLYVMINGSGENLTFAIEEDAEWRLAVDTSLVSPEDIVEAGTEKAISGREYLVKLKSVVVLIALHRPPATV